MHHFQPSYGLGTLAAGPKTFSVHHFVHGSVCVFFSRHSFKSFFCWFFFLPVNQIGATLDELFVCILKFEIILAESIIECRCKRAVSVAYSKWISVFCIFIVSRPHCYFRFFLCSRAQNIILISIAPLHTHTHTHCEMQAASVLTIQMGEKKLWQLLCNMLRLRSVRSSCMHEAHVCIIK